MKRAYIFSLLVFVIALQYLTGCATAPNTQENDTNKPRLQKVKEKLDAAADKYFPQVPDKSLGKSMPGEPIGYAYDFMKPSDKTGNLVLLKIPMCMEKRDQFISYTDRASNAAGVAAVLATPLILSAPVLVDPVFFIERGLKKSRNKTIEKTGTLSTGRALLCGEKEPAPGETLIIQSTGDMPLTYIKTDNQGRFSINDIFSKAGDSPSLNIFIKQENSSYYLTTMFNNE
ncbi:MAG: hypothetical protein C0403_06425 [Desulfobacterium sp.]|nr:hypothetical protein [Desulfobacterium sp.]